jgi:tetratricopeptide (TPR) repeat protein
MSASALPEPEQLRQAEAAYSAGDLDASARLFAPVARSTDVRNAARALYGLGMLALATKRQAEAARLFRAATQMDADHANSWYQLGCLEEEGSRADAVRDFRRALVSDPGHAGASRKLAVLDPPAKPQQGRDQWPSPQSRPPASQPSPVGSSLKAGDPREGAVTNFQQRVEQRGRRMVYVWDFRVARDGLEPISVEMRAYRFDGAISNGDRVRLPRGARPGKVLHLNRVTNLSAGAEARATRRPRAIFTAFGIVFRTAFMVVWLAIAGTIVYVALRAAHKIP